MCVCVCVYLTSSQHIYIYIYFLSPGVLCVSVNCFHHVRAYLHRTIEDLYEELVTQGIIVRTPQVKLVDLEGEYSYLGTTLRQANVEPMPSISDVRRLVTEFAILPLGEFYITVCHPTSRWALRHSLPSYL